MPSDSEAECEDTCRSTSGPFEQLLRSSAPVQARKWMTGVAWQTSFCPALHDNGSADPCRAIPNVVCTMLSARSRHHVGSKDAYVISWVSMAPMDSSVWLRVALFVL